jgi:hypothetical protein
MSFGSVVIPINGFGWLPFLEIMDLKEEFVERFPEVELKQDCMDVAVWDNQEVNEYIWNKCLDINSTVKTFISNQNGQFKDLMCPHRYSIGSIVFSHTVWEDMGGWKVQDGYDKVLDKQRRYLKYINAYKTLRHPETKNRYTRLNAISDIVTGANKSEVGGDEVGIYEYTTRKGLVIPVTTQGLVFHFSFGPLEQYLMNTIYLKLN